MEFPKREELINKLKKQYDVANSSDNSSLLKDEDNFDRDVQTNVTEESKVFSWIRVYLNEEYENIKKGDVVKLRYNLTGEICDLIFGSYNMVGSNKDTDGDVLTDYNSEEDKKVLCLMVDIKSIENDKTLPLIRTLFRQSKWYAFNLLKLNDISILHNEKELPYYSIDF